MDADGVGRRAVVRNVMDRHDDWRWFLRRCKIVVISSIGSAASATAVIIGEQTSYAIAVSAVRSRNCDNWVVRVRQLIDPSLKVRPLAREYKSVTISSKKGDRD